jgi:hypothetical protein
MEIFCIAASCWPWTRRRPSRRRLALHPHCSNLIEFPADEAFDAWFNSQEYQASLEGRNVELLGDGIGSNALDAIVTALTWDIPEQGSPRVWWFYGTGSAKALTTELTKELWFNPAMYTRFNVMIA